MPAPITISVPVEHADDLIASFAAPRGPVDGGLKASAPIRYLPAGTPAPAPPMLAVVPPMAPPADMAPASAMPPMSLPPVDLTTAESPSKWNRIFKPMLEAAGTFFAPSAMPFIPGTPQHTELEQRLATGQANTELAQQRAAGGQGTGEAEQARGKGAQELAQGQILGQEASGGLGTSVASQQAISARKAALGLQATEQVLGDMGLTGRQGGGQPGEAAPQPPPGHDIVEGLPQVVTSGQIPDSVVNDWNRSAERLAAASGFVPELAPLAGQVGRTAASETLLGREQNTERTGAMPAAIRPVFDGIMSTFAEQGYNVNDPRVQQAAMLLATQQRANAGVTTRANQSFRVVQDANGQQQLVPVTTVSGPANPLATPGGVPGVAGPKASAGAAQTIEQPNGLPTLEKPNQQTITSLSQLLDTWALLQDIREPLAKLASANGNDPTAMANAKAQLANFAYSHGFALPPNRDVVTQLGGLLGVVGGSAFAKASRRYELIEQAMSHLPAGNMDPKEAEARLDQALKVYPQMLGEQLRSQWGSNAAVAALKYHIPLSMPGIGYQYWPVVLGPDGKPTELAKVGGKYYDPVTGAQIKEH